MGFKDKMTKYYSDAYMNKYGDRMTSVSGTVLSVKTETKSFLGIFNRLHVWLVVKSDAGKQIAKCEYKRNRWFKKPEFIPVKIGHKVIIMGLKGIKGQKDSDVIAIQNVLNLTTRRDLLPFDHSQLKKSKQQATKMMRR